MARFQGVPAINAIIQQCDELLSDIKYLYKQSRKTFTSSGDFILLLFFFK